MESRSSCSGSRSRLRSKKISLEDYVDFLLSRNHIRLTVRYLHDILFIHGFRGLGLPKQSLVDAVNTLDLINPSRSTLKSSISATASITLEDIIADLNDLNWQECCVTSIQTLNSPKQSFSDLQSTQLSAPQPKGKRKRISRLSYSIAPDDSSSSALIPFGSS